MLSYFLVAIKWVSNLYEFIENSATFGLAKLRGQSLKINVLSGSFKAPQLLYVVVIAKLRFSSPYTCRSVGTRGQGWGQSPYPPQILPRIEAEHSLTKYLVLLNLPPPMFLTFLRPCSDMELEKNGFSNMQRDWAIAYLLDDCLMVYSSGSKKLLGYG